MGRTLLAKICSTLVLIVGIVSQSYGQEWKVQTTILSPLQYSGIPFRDSGWFAGVSGGFRLPLEAQVGVFQVGQNLISIDAGLSLGILPAAQGFYSGVTLGMGIHYNGELQGFYSALYPLYDMLWVQESRNKRLAEWQAAADILGFEIDLSPLPIQVGAHLRCAFAWISDTAIPAVELGATLGYHRKP